MRHLQQLLAAPTARGLSDVLKAQQRLVDEMLFRTIELTALVEAGQHRFIGRALDDMERAERELGGTEIVRSAITEALLGSPPGTEPRLSDVLSILDDETAETITTTASQIRSGLERIDQVRRDAASTAAERASRAQRAVGAATSGTRPYGRT